MLARVSRRLQIFAVILVAYFLSSFFRRTDAVVAEGPFRDVGPGASDLGTSALVMVTARAFDAPLLRRSGG